MPRPNLLLITTDQQRGDCLGCAGHPVLETPYLDQLASEGVRFRRAYSSVPACTPARAALLTGMDQWNHGRLAMAGADALEFPATLPGELARAGYHTQAVGKMHHHPQRRTTSGGRRRRRAGRRAAPPRTIARAHGGRAAAPSVPPAQRGPTPPCPPGAPVGPWTGTPADPGR